VTLPMQEWKQKEAPQSSTTEPAASDQTAAPGGLTATDIVLGGQTAPSFGQTARAQEEHSPLTSRAGQASSSNSQLGSPIGASDSPTAAEDGQIIGPGDLITS
jgi:hypothetical protein